MTGSVRMVLALLPLAAYFFVLGVWQSGKRPRVVAGPTDFGLLSFGLGGLIAFGPFGQFLVRMIFPHPNLPAWLAVTSLVGLIAMIAAIRTRRRLVIYNINAADLDRALETAMNSIANPVSRTVRGFEDVPGRRGITVEISPSLRIAMVEAHGEQPERLIEAIHSVIDSRLSEVKTRATPLATVWFALSCITLILLPLGLVLLFPPDMIAIREWLGLLLRKLAGG